MVDLNRWPPSSGACADSERRPAVSVQIIDHQEPIQPVSIEKA